MQSASEDEEYPNSIIEPLNQSLVTIVTNDLKAQLLTIDDFNQFKQYVRLTRITLTQFEINVLGD